MIPLLWLLACGGDDDDGPDVGADNETGDVGSDTDTDTITDTDPPTDTEPFVAPALSDVHAHLIDAFVLVEGAELVARTEALQLAGEALCADVNITTLEAARQAWLDIREPWKTLEVVRFGPAMEEPYRIAPKIDFWPTRPNAIEIYLYGDEGLTPEDFDTMGGATRGLAALEYIWFDGTDEEVLAALADERRCAYGAGLAADSHVLAERYVAAWSDDWRDRLLDPGAYDDHIYMSDQEVLDEWVNRMAFTVEDLRFDRLGKPMGDSAGGEPLPGSVESPYSDASLADVRYILDGVERVFEGNGGPGVAALLPPGDPVATAFRTELALVRDALLVVPEPLSEAVVDARPQVQATQESLRDLQVVIQINLAQELGVTVVFNDNDGD